LVYWNDTEGMDTRTMKTKRRKAYEEKPTYVVHYNHSVTLDKEVDFIIQETGLSNWKVYGWREYYPLFGFDYKKKKEWLATFSSKQDAIDYVERQ